ncbi:ABC transporter substrate-binding protein [Pseudomonas typographi]|uniref:ABC transporter substrate-binding protein n=1 Tax=Pseudomonas typographi TaxID=2715964 RepID=UPI00168224D6|nr:ABC transporter substrate-binding protein [Pseudomonas typographi]MBD1586195.1 ABC transporter substrate-binding protein [Pseudomonas typographi]
MPLNTPASALHRRHFLKASGTLALAAPFALNNGWGFAAGEAPRSGGTLIIGQYQEPTVYDPNRQYSWETFRVDRHLYESLVGEDLSQPASAGAPPLIPALAQHWEASADFTTFTFDLRQGVRFHDGTPFDAEAVRFNVRRFTDKQFEHFDVQASASMRPVYGQLKALNVLGSHRVQYVFERPFMAFLRLLPQGNYVSGFFSPLALQTYGQNGLAEHACGTGPFKLVSRVRGEKTELLRNDDYWGRKPWLERLVFRPIADDATRLSALQTGEIDILTRTPTDAVETLHAGGFHVHDSSNAGELFLGWNFNNRFAKDLKVRQAVIHAIDRDGLAKTLFSGYALPNRNILNIGNDAYDARQQDYPYDPQAARALLREAGHGEGSVSFTIATDVANQPTIEWIRDDLAKVGIDVRIVSQEWLSYSSHLSSLDADTALFSMEWGFVTPYWLKLVYDGYVKARGGGGDLLGGQLAAAIEAAAQAEDEEHAIGLWQAANALLQQQAGVVPLLTFNRYFTSAPNVRGFNVPAQNFYDLSNVWLQA